MSAGIFISHASEDRKIAHTLCDALESRGFKCWIASRDIGAGENFQIAIVRAIRNAKMMLLVFTANSNSSEEMSKELALASQHKLIVLPLRVEDVAPNDAFAYEFSTRQWIDFFADWEWAINQLCIRLANAMKPEGEEEAVPTAGPADAVEAKAPAVETLKMPTANAAATPAAPVAVPSPSATAAVAATAKPVAAKPAEIKPAPVKPAPAKPAVVDKTAPTGAGAAPAAKKSPVLVFVAIAAVLIVGAGIATPMLMGKKLSNQPVVGPEIKGPSASSAAPVVATTELAPPGSPSAQTGSAAVSQSSSVQAVNASAASGAAAQLAAVDDPSASSAAPVAKHTHKTHVVHVATSRADLPY